jgi:NAD-dependent dihydropyrimidine dehydrogenase PreA subunit
MDQSCVAVCPVDCIATDPTIDRKFCIDPEACIDCGSRETACPNGAIFSADRLPPAWARYAVIDATYWVDPDAARSGVEAPLTAA